MLGVLLRLLGAVCAAPLIVGWLVAAAYLDAHLLPSPLLFLVLSLVGVGLAVLIGMVFSLHFRVLAPDSYYGKVPYRLGVAAAIATAVTVLATLSVSSAWAFGSIAEQRECTVVALDSVVEEHTSTGTRNYPLVRLACADGRADSIGGRSPSVTAHAWRFWEVGDHVRVAYDPSGDLPSRAADDLRMPIRTWLAGIAMAATMLLHVLIVMAVTRQRRRAP